MTYLKISLIIIGFFTTVTGISQSISGPTSVDFNDTDLYSNSQTGIPGFSEYYWNIIGGTELAGSTETQVSVKWDQPCSGRVEKWASIPSNGEDELFLGLNVAVNNIPVINYVFDNSGNRTNRNIIYLNSTTIKKSAGGNGDYGSEQEKYMDEVGDLIVTIYPNPTQSEVNIFLDNYNSEVEYSISVFNLHGGLIKEISEIQQANIINLSDQPDGVYIITVSYGQNISRWKIVKD
ncbi:MAG: T9SS type A sorting domain-containing protein [Saprospiraceae bacterium]|nr:T9SS type A sorting domain-containing protein [Saprospiraceae bacterium]